MFEITDVIDCSTLTGNEYICFLKIVLDRYGKYCKGLYKGENVWINLRFPDNPNKEAKLHGAIDNATLEWEKQGRPEEGIAIPLALLIEAGNSYST